MATAKSKAVPKAGAKPKSKEKLRASSRLASDEVSWVENAPELAEELIHVAAKNGLTLDYRPGTLGSLDQLIGIKAKEKRSKDINHFLHIAGCYLGEVVVRNLGGRWHVNENPSDILPPVSVRLPNGGLCNPIGKVINRFANGWVDSVAFFFVGLKDALKSHPAQRKRGAR